MSKYYAIVQQEPDDTYMQVDRDSNLQIYEDKSRADIFCPDHCEVVSVFVTKNDCLLTLEKIRDRLKDGDYDEWTIQALVDLANDAIG